MKTFIILSILFLTQFALNAQSEFSELAKAYAEVNEFENAISNELRNLEFVKVAYGTKNENYIKSLTDLAYYFSQIDNQERSNEYEMEAIKVAGEIYGQSSREYIAFLTNLANRYYDGFSFSKAMNLFIKIKGIQKQNSILLKKDYLSILGSLADCFFNIGDYQNALDAKQEYLELNIISHELTNPNQNLINDINFLAICYKALGRFQESIDLCNKYLKTITDSTQKSKSESVDILFTVAGCYYSLGDYSNALALFEETCQIQKETESNYELSERCIAQCYMAMGNYEESIKLLTNLLESSDLIWSYEINLSLLADCYYYLDDYENALYLYNMILDIRKELWGTNDLKYAETLFDIGKCNYLIREYNEAVMKFTECLNIRKDILETSDSSIINTLNNLAYCFEGLKCYPKAIELYLQVMEIQKSSIDLSSPDYVETLNNIADCYKYLDEYKNALSIYREVMEIQKSTIDLSSPDYVETLNNIADCYKCLDEHKKAIDKYSEVMKFYIKNKGTSTLTYAGIIGNLAICYYSVGEYRKGMSLLEESLVIQKEKFNTTDTIYTNTLINLARCQYNLGDYKESIFNYGEALNLLKENSNVCVPQFFDVYDGLARCNYAIGDNSNAIYYYQEIMNIINESSYTYSPFYAKSVTGIANCYLSMGKYHEAINLYSESIDVTNRTYGESNPYYSALLVGLAEGYLMIGEYHKAVTLNEKALYIINERPDAILKNAALIHLARSYRFIGEFNKAIDVYEEAMELITAYFGQDHPEYAAALNGLADCYCDMGNYPRAIELYLKTLNVFYDNFGEIHPEYAKTCGNIALCYKNIDDINKALEFGTTALNTIKKSVGEAHPDYAIALNNLGLYYAQAGDDKKAFKFYNDALNITKQSKGDSHPDYAINLYNLSSFYFIAGNHKSALNMISEALQIIKESRGIFNLDYLKILITSIIANYMDGNIIECKNLILASNQDIPKYIMSNFNSMTLSERHYFSEIFLPEIQRVNNIIGLLKDAQLNNIGYNWVLLLKGILLNTELEFNNFINELDSSEILEKYNTAIRLRRLLNRQYEIPIIERYIDIDSLENEIYRLERGLMAESKEYGDYTEAFKIKMEDVKNAMNNEDCAIEFIECPDFNGEIMYSAYILRKYYDAPIIVELFDKHDLEQFNILDTYKSKEASRIIWGKLLPYIEGVENVYFAPDGVLNQIAIECLQDPNGDGIISDRFNIHRLSSTREIALNITKKSINSATVYGGILYDMDVSTMESEGRKYSEVPSHGTRTLNGLIESFGTRGGAAYLKHTKTEAEQICELMNENNISFSIHSGTNASEESFKSMSGKHINIIHVATHGFYWGRDDAEYVASLNDRLNFMLDLGNSDKRNHEDRALSRTGLFLAGANNILRGMEIPSSVEDGILTAQEIANLDLRGLDLVILSACQTGMGDITADGVFGLQRGFKKAGANSILMSLWDVDDEATQILMTSFYQNYLGGMSKREALLSAQKTVRETPGFEDPEYWAAFILLDALN